MKDDLRVVDECIRQRVREGKRWIRPSMLMRLAHWDFSRAHEALLKHYESFGDLDIHFTAVCPRIEDCCEEFSIPRPDPNSFPLLVKCKHCLQEVRVGRERVFFQYRITDGAFGRSAADVGSQSLMGEAQLRTSTALSVETAQENSPEEAMRRTADEQTSLGRLTQEQIERLIAVAQTKSQSVQFNFGHTVVAGTGTMGATVAGRDQSGSGFASTAVHGSPADVTKATEENAAKAWHKHPATLAVLGGVLTILVALATRLIDLYLKAPAITSSPGVAAPPP